MSQLAIATTALMRQVNAWVKVAFPVSVVFAPTRSVLQA